MAQSAVHWVVSECRIWRKGCPPHTVRVDAGSGKLWMGGGARDVGTRMVRIQTQRQTGMQAVGWLGCRHRDGLGAS